MDFQEVNTICEQFQAGQWPQFLQAVSIDGLRGWAGQSVEFKFPVIAVVGEKWKRQKHAFENLCLRL